MFKCPHCKAVFNEPTTKASIIDEETSDEIALPKEMRMRVCPHCNKKFKFEDFIIDEREQ